MLQLVHLGIQIWTVRIIRIGLKVNAAIGSDYHAESCESRLVESISNRTLEHHRMHFHTNLLTSLLELLQHLHLSFVLASTADLTGDSRRPATRFLAQCRCRCMIGCYPEFFFFISNDQKVVLSCTAIGRWSHARNHCARTCAKCIRTYLRDRCRRPRTCIECVASKRDNGYNNIECCILWWAAKLTISV